jgi:hypothetical protein
MPGLPASALHSSGCYQKQFMTLYPVMHMQSPSWFASATALRLFADQGSGVASVLSTKNPGFFLLDKEFRNLAFFRRRLIVNKSVYPVVGIWEAYNFLAAVTCATLWALTRLTTMAWFKAFFTPELCIKQTHYRVMMNH